MKSSVRFATSGEVSIAYQVLGNGPIDLVYVNGSFTHLDVLWELPAYRHYCERLAEFTRLILFDKRGMGLSDRVPSATTLEERMDDVRAVLDAVGSEVATVMGSSEGGPLAILFAAAHPERTARLILQGAEVCERIRPDWPWGEGTQAEFDVWMARLPEIWGKPSATLWRVLAPSLEPDLWLEEFAGRLRTNSGTPRAAEQFMRMAFDIDVRDVVPSIRVPTLIVHRRDDVVCNVGNARWLAANLPGARYVELTGGDHVPWFQPDEIISEIREFLTGEREASSPDRVLATVLFTDIVDSTRRAVAVGDRRWQDLVDLHHVAVRRELSRFRGQEIDTAGDGFFASFDGPARGIRCARAIIEAVRPLGLEVRAGLHTGELEMGAGRPRGIAVNIGARVAALAGPGEILVSRTVTDLVAGSGLRFTDRGTHVLKGLDGELQIFACV